MTGRGVSLTAGSSHPVPTERLPEAAARGYPDLVATPLVSIGIDTPDPPAAARWWADALGWDVVATALDEVKIAPANGRAPALLFLRVDDPKVAKNRIHLDLASQDASDMETTIARLVAAGARPVDVGQRDVPWTVLSDPEGNEFCVLEPRDRYRGIGRLASMVIDSADPSSLARFWAAATGWPVGFEQGGVASLHQPDDRPPDVDFVPVADAKRVKNRLHPDVLATDGDVEAAARTLIELGARPVDIGQGDVPWVVLADPEGNELCVLPPDVVGEDH
jgi:predicted enzyme related to lactoylglutathione lyase